jgi:dipeptide/tripeptide permease
MPVFHVLLFSPLLSVKFGSPIGYFLKTLTACQGLSFPVSRRFHALQHPALSDIEQVSEKGTVLALLILVFVSVAFVYPALVFMLVTAEFLRFVTSLLTFIPELQGGEIMVQRETHEIRSSRTPGLFSSLIPVTF